MKEIYRIKFQFSEYPFFTGFDESNSPINSRRIISVDPKRGIVETEDGNKYIVTKMHGLLYGAFIVMKEYLDSPLNTRTGC